MTNYSIREAEALAFKAFRGAYLTWGLAEEAARATGWLLTNGFAGMDSIVLLLDENDSMPCADLGPDDPETNRRPRPGVGALCPVITGALLLDSAKHIAAGSMVHAGPVAHPALLLPFAAELAKAESVSVQIGWAGFEALLGDGGAQIVRGCEKLSIARAQSVTVETKAARPIAQSITHARVELSDASRAQLEHFAFRTFVPETEESRRLGAGGGTVDSD